MLDGNKAQRISKRNKIANRNLISFLDAFNI